MRLKTIFNTITNSPKFQIYIQVCLLDTSLNILPVSHTNTFKAQGQALPDSLWHHLPNSHPSRCSAQAP